MSHFVYLFDRREGHSVSLFFLPNISHNNVKYRNIGYIQFIKLPPVTTYMTTYKVQIKEDEFDHWKSLFIDEKVLLEIPEVDLIRIIKWNEFESKLGMTYKTIGRTHV